MKERIGEAAGELEDVDEETRGGLAGIGEMRGVFEERDDVVRLWAA